MLSATDTFCSVSQEVLRFDTQPYLPYYLPCHTLILNVFAYNVCLLPNSSQSFLLQIFLLHYYLKTAFLPLPLPFSNQLYPVTSSTPPFLPSGLLSHTLFLQHSSFFSCQISPTVTHLTISVTSLCYICSLLPLLLLIQL